MESYIIVGGGLAGLTAANALAQPGRKVTLLEQSEHLGGRAITQQEAGFFLNLGPHALYRGGPATRTFEEWNIPFEGHLPAQDRTHLVYEGKKYPLIANTASLLTSPLFGIGEKLEAGNLFRLLAAGQAPHQNMREWIEDHARSPKVRSLAAALTRLTTFVADQAHLSASAALRQISLAIAKNVVFLDRGWQTLIDGLAARARSLGVEIRCSAPLNSLAFLDADGIVLAVPPPAVENLTGVSFPNLRPVRVACLDLGLSSLPENAANFGLGIDRPLYYSVHSAVAKLAPEGSALIQMAKYLEADSDPVVDRIELEEFADVLAPGWRDRVTMTRFLPKMTVSYAMAGLEGRPDVDALKKDGIVMCGDWVGPDHMLTDAVVASALSAAAMVQKGKSARNAA
ncbi:MAG TPA: FAD-dependent oxidoreductase [Bryobacteraceae bacterium]|jgi:phytoene dehydrogenase-like protein|nr:FAD-dependent oxidoreductase [Bryobacteraceae bacterium]